MCLIVANIFLVVFILCQFCVRSGENVDLLSIGNKSEISKIEAWSQLLSISRNKIEKIEVDQSEKEDSFDDFSNETLNDAAFVMDIREFDRESEWDRLLNARGKEPWEVTESPKLWTYNVTEVENVTPEALALTLNDNSEEEEVVRGSSLAFVFDTTGSMGDELNQVKHGASQILAALKNHPDIPIYNYVLVPFGDPGIGPVTVTTDDKKFKEQLLDITVAGGGDCPEMSIGAIKKALEVILPKSYIYVFTDASAKDAYLQHDVLPLIQRKEARVDFIMTDDCDDLKKNSYQVYQIIAEMSSGQVYRLSKKEVKEVLQYVKVALQPNVVNLLAQHKPATLNNKPDEHELMVDETLKQFTISVSGTNASIRVTDPKGKNVDGPPQLEPLLTLNNVKIVNVKEPDPGPWKVMINSESDYTVRSTGLSGVHFHHGFSTVETTNMMETNHRPLQGAQCYILIETSDIDKVHNLTTVDIVGLNGEVIQHFDLEQVPGVEGAFRGGAFVPPSTFFYLGITGFGKDGFPIKRITTTAISSQLPEKPIITVRPKTTGRINGSGILKCYVESVVPFTVQWYKDGRIYGRPQNYSQTCEAILEIENLTLESQGNFTCRASNVAGVASKSTYLAITGDPPSVRVTSRISASLGQTVLLDCFVKSQLDYTVTWSQFTAKNDHSGILHPVSKGIKFPNNTLLVEDVTPEDEGWYVCTAANKGGKSQGRIFLLVKDPLKVSVEPKNVTYAMGDSARLSCSATGKPQPKLEWRKDQRTLTRENPLIELEEINEKLNLVIDYLEKEHRGIYSCHAINSEESVSANVDLIYTEEPTMTAKENNMMVKVGVPAVLRCSATGEPYPLIKWYKSGNEITQDSRFQIEEDGTLIIESTRSVDAGEYSCVGENDYGYDSDYIGLFVGSPPAFLQKPRDKKIEINHNGTIPCSAIGMPPAEIKWKRVDETQLDPDRMMILPSGALRIIHMKYEDEGYYVCTAENAFGNVTNQIFIGVSGLEKPVPDRNIELTDVKVLSGDEITIPCGIVIGNPPGLVRWFKDGALIKQTDHTRISETGDLILKETTAADRGDYLCMVSNVAGNSSRPYQLLVSESPKIIKDVRKDLKATKGGEIVIPCPAEGYPPPTITWTKNGLPLPTSSSIFQDEDGSLIIRNLTIENAGTYVCTALNSVGSASKATSVHVQVPPTVPEDLHEASQNIVEGHVVVLNCKINAVPTPMIQWFKDEEPLLQNEEKIQAQPEVLRFVANVEDTGVYKCVATNEAGSAFKEFNVTILVPPNILDRHKEQSVKARAGIPVTLHCNVYGVPIPTILWQRNGMYLTQNNTDVTLLDTGLLIIQNVTKESSGAYICEAENMAGITQRFYYLQVNFPPRIIEEVNASIPIKVKEGEELSLPCLVEGNPKPSILWRKNGLPILNHHSDLLILEDHTLVFLQVTRETTGVYKCEAVNEEGAAQQEYNVEVMVPPSIMPDFYPTKLEVNEGDSLVLTCPTTSSVPPPTIQWIKDGNPLSFLLQERSDEAQMKLSDDQRSLTIIEAHPSDNGNYSCVATNLAGRTDAKFLVDVLMTPHFEEFNHVAHRTILTGGEVTLNCSVTGNPQPKVTWRKGNSPITPQTTPGVQISLDKQHLIIPHGRVYHSGTYICSAANKVNTKEREFYVNVIEPPRIEGPLQETLEVMIQDNVTLHCPAAGTPEPTITWMKVEKNKKILNETSEFLTIIHADCSHDGLYSCDVTNTAGTKTKYFNLTVLEPPVIEGHDVTDELQVPLGGNLTLRCKTKGQPRPDITWLHNGHILNENKIRYRRQVAVDYFGGLFVSDDGYATLQLSNVSESNKGMYTLLAANKAGVVEKNFEVKVLVPPKPVDNSTDSESLTIVHPLPITLKCPVYADPSPRISWYRNDNILISNDNVILLGHELRIRKSSSMYSGNYSCMAVNPAGNFTKLFKVNVIEPPKLEENENTSYNGIVNETLMLNCSGKNDGDHKYLWLHSSTPLQNSSRIAIINGGRFLIFSQLELSDSGKYSCIVTNIAGSAENVYYIQVNEPPILSDQSSADLQRKKIPLHHPFSLHCLFTGHPPPEVSWYKDGDFLNETQPEDNLHSDGTFLTVQNAGPEHAGKYKCIAENIVGVQELTFQVDITVTGEWTTWSDWSSCSVTCGLGEQTRERICDVGLQVLDPRLEVDKSNCVEDDQQKRKCFTECPVDGGWSGWTSWTSCSATCGLSTRKRYRTCDTPSPKNGGKSCDGEESQEELCEEIPCPVNGQWSEWTPWSECSASCGGGVKQRSRKCDSPEPKNGGENCQGWGNEFAVCNRHKCQGQGRWLSWSEWSPCSTTCGKGHRKRFRKCKASRRGKTCKGENMQIDKCFVRSCDPNSFPTSANLRIKGKINGKEIDNYMDASIASLKNERLVTANMNDILKHENKWFPYTPFLLSPLSWNAAYETDNADNGYSLTNGNYFSQSDIQFATGEGLIVKHKGEGLGEDGSFQVEIEVAGEVPLIEPHASVIIKSLEQDFVQTSSNTLYSTVQNDVDVEGQKLPFSWNSSIYYDTEQGTMPYLVEKLSMKDIYNVYNPDTQNISYIASSTIGRKYEENKCPEGFLHEPELLHCRDIDECEEGIDKCGSEFFCENTFGSYECVCPQGFKPIKNQITCDDIDECAEGLHHCSHTCKNTQGSYTCTCPKGLYLGSDMKICKDYSESNEMYYDDATDIQNEDYGFKISNQPRRNYQEYKSPQTRSDFCPPGYFYSNYECRDYNECEDDPTICDKDETCLNKPGSYQCLSTPCPYGFERIYPSRNCIKYCRSSGICEKDTKISETVTFNAVTLKSSTPLHDILHLDIIGEPHVDITRTKFRVVDPDELFRIRVSHLRGSLYSLHRLKSNTLYRVKAVALSYDTNEVLLYSTEFIIFIIVV